MLDTGLKHILKKEYVIYYKTGEGRKYLYYLSGGSANFTDDIDDAMKIKNLKAAKGAFYLASEFCKNELHVSKTETIVEDIDLDSEKEDEE